MFLARVTGSVVATPKVASMTGRKLLTVDPQSADAMYGMSQVELARGNAEALKKFRELGLRI